MSTETTPSPERARSATVFSPAVDIDEGRDDIVLWADLPGVSEENIRITLEKKVLTLEARVEPATRPAHHLVHREYEDGDFRRVFTVSDSVDEGKISATLKDGVLRLALPKIEPIKPRTINVNVT